MGGQRNSGLFTYSRLSQPDIKSAKSLTNELNFLSLNVCGLKSKSIVPEFQSLISNFDIVGFQETRLDRMNEEQFLPDFHLYFKSRHKSSRFKSGGLGLAVRKSISKYITVLENSSKLALWFKISNKLTGYKDDILGGVVYVPPENTKYSVNEPFTELENELNLFRQRYKSIVLLGDFNARTSSRQDYIEVDKFIAHEQNFDDIYTDSETQFSLLETANVSVKRMSLDQKVNNYGYQLLDLCKSQDIFIVNGRVFPDSKVGGTTCRDASVVDYFICSVDMFNVICEFSVLEFCDLYSDIHNPITLSLNVRLLNDFSNQNNEPISEKVRLWNNAQQEKFLENFDWQLHSEIDKQLLELSNDENITQVRIDQVVEKCSSLFITSAKNAFGTILSGNKTFDSSSQWFGPDCKKARRAFFTAKRNYKTRKSETNKTILKQKSKAYKNMIRKHHKLFKKKKIKKLRNLKSKNPKAYWKILNPKNRNENVGCNLNDFYDFFQEINSADNDENNEDYVPDISNDEINKPISKAEIEKAIKSLNNNKACALDNILNEHLKASKDAMINIYEKLFNIILNTGFFPSSWAIGVIKPVYKNKGAKDDPKNYRPITLLSCFSKLFTSIINNRLNNFSEQFNIIEPNQAGFRKGFSATDNLFILYTLVNILSKNKKKLFSAFIDFKSAFDTVWRVGLWKKLLRYNINGKVFNVIKNMYSNVKSCVRLNTDHSNFFSCNLGVRQGENLSPFLFSIFLNDLEEYLRNNNVDDINCETPEIENELYIYLKLSILLYADDTVILSESDSGLQHALNVFYSYCNEWQLNVNVEKTKVLIFSKGRPNRNYNFVFNDKQLEIVNEYKYLGIYMSRSGSFLKTKKYIAEQGSKAMYSLLSRVRKLDLPFDIIIDLYNKMVLPVLLYGCELWGYGNLEVIERVQLKFFKSLYYLKRSTPNFMIYGEFGIFPLRIEIQSRMISFWTKLLNYHNNKLSSVMYMILLSLNRQEIKNAWILEVKNILVQCGMSGFWDLQVVNNPKWLKEAVKLKLKDIFINSWFNTMEASRSGANYCLFKENFESESYLRKLDFNQARSLLAFRTRNHKLPVEITRWNKNINIIMSDKCVLCNQDKGDEFHVLLSCRTLMSSRKQYLPTWCNKRPNILKYKKLMQSQNIKVLRNLSAFIKIILQLHV